jgi:hypothetical protein
MARRTRAGGGQGAQQGFTGPGEEVYDRGVRRKKGIICNFLYDVLLYRGEEFAAGGTSLLVACKEIKAMAFDYEEERRKFLTELKNGEFAIERIPNKGEDYAEKESRDMQAYDDYLSSNAFKQLNDEASAGK